MTADIRLAVSVIQTVFAQNHRAAATAADDHANTPNNKKKPLPQPELNRTSKSSDMNYSSPTIGVRFKMEKGQI